MQTLYIPKYNIYYRVNPRNSYELQWSNKVYGPATQWQSAYTFPKPIRALDVDDTTGMGVVVLNGNEFYIGSAMRSWCRKYYSSSDRIYSLYAVGG